MSNQVGKPESVGQPSAVPIGVAPGSGMHLCAMLGTRRCGGES